MPSLVARAVTARRCGTAVIGVFLRAAALSSAAYCALAEIEAKKSSDARPKTRADQASIGVGYHDVESRAPGCDLNLSRVVGRLCNPVSGPDPRPEGFEPRPSA